MVVIAEDGTGHVAAAGLSALAATRWGSRVETLADGAGVCRFRCRPELLREICDWLAGERGFAFATLVVDETTDEAGRPAWSLLYVFLKDAALPRVEIELLAGERDPVIPSLCGLANGPSVDWHEREVEDLFGISFDGHPRLGEFILHEDWPEGTAPMRRAFDPQHRREERQSAALWQPPTVVEATGAFAMPVGPVFSDFAESAHFLLETVGEDVIRTIPRLFYKYRGVEKIAEGKSVDEALLLAERFSGNAAFAHGLAFCQAVEAICGVAPPPRAVVLRTIFAELERLRHHAATITGICNSTALAVATAQAALIEESLLRLSGEVARHRYLFGVLRPGGLAVDLGDPACRRVASATAELAARLDDLQRMLTYSSSFLDRLEEVGIVSQAQALSYGLVGPIARASGLFRDIRRLLPYAAYANAAFDVPVETEGDGYARLRVFFEEAAQSAALIARLAAAPPAGPVAGVAVTGRAGAALSAVEAPSGAAFHWLRLDERGLVARYRVTPPAFPNWHGFHLAAENFAFQDFPIILASFGLSNAECDR
jgi:Ni,Fe-hydrogenase III large subunit/Ni,Fe-hydrogenase III component G